MFYTLLWQEKSFILDTVVKEQGLESPHQEAFFTGTLQVNCSKMQVPCFSWCA
jgi:hypothetical protein